MLLVHGFPELWYSWRWQLEAFKEDYEVVAFDLRGYGQTGKPKVQLCAFLGVNCTDELLDSLCCTWNGQDKPKAKILAECKSQE